MNDNLKLPTPLASTQWLADNIGAPNLVVIDASWRMPGEGDAYTDYRERHIPGAVFFAIDDVADRATSLPHMLAPTDVFERAVDKMGVSNESRIVVYDDQGLFSSARVWWNFLAMGHSQVAVLDGGLPRWISDGRPVSSDPVNPAPGAFKAAPRPDIVADHQRVRSALAGGACILDARPDARFRGAAPEPRRNLRSGHMPGSRNVPSSSLFDAGGLLKTPDELSKIFHAADLAPGRQAITSCGSGITAAILILALETLGHRPYALYDGSWAEWGREENDPEEFPVEAGEG